MEEESIINRKEKKTRKEDKNVEKGGTKRKNTIPTMFATKYRKCQWVERGNEKTRSPEDITTSAHKMHKKVPTRGSLMRPH